MAHRELCCSTRVTALESAENTQPQDLRIKALRLRNVLVTRRCLEEPQVILAIASENFHRTRAKVEFSSRNVSNVTT